MWSVAVCAWALCTCVGATEVCDLNGEDSATYRQEELATNVLLGYGMAVDWNTDLLYYNTIKSDERVVNFEFLNAVLDLVNKTVRVFEDKSGWCSFTVDQFSGEVYAGCKNSKGHGGLYMLDRDAGKFIIVGAKGEDIHFVHFTGGLLYYSTGDTVQVHTYVDGLTYPVSHLTGLQVWGLTKDGEGDWVYRNSTGVYHRTWESGVTTRYASSDKIRWPSKSPSGDVYMCDTDALYRIDGTTLHRIVPTLGCDALAIDASGNFIFWDRNSDKIIRIIKC